VDPEQARRDVESVDEAIVRARDGSGPPGAQYEELARARAQAAVEQTRSAVPRRVPGAALDGLQGVRGVRQVQGPRELDADDVRRSLDEVDAAVERSRKVADRPNIAQERAAAEPPALPARRVPGATLAALKSGGGRGALADTPESPQAVLDWVNDLEAALPPTPAPSPDRESTDE
jgi:hypothetical protein